MTEITEEEVAAAIEAEMDSVIEVEMDSEPKLEPKPAPALPEEPELVGYWRKIIAYRDDLCTLITKWETVPYSLGEIPTQHLKELRSRLDDLDSEIVTKARWQANDRGHSVSQLRELADIPRESERQRKAYWVQLWLTHRDPLTRASVAGEMGRDDLEELERRARAQLDDAGQFRQRAKVARCMVDIADRERG